MSLNKKNNAMKNNHTIIKKRINHTLFSSILMLSLSACGGGGSTKSKSSAPSIVNSPQTISVIGNITESTKGNPLLLCGLSTLVNAEGKPEKVIEVSVLQESREFLLTVPMSITFGTHKVSGSNDDNLKASSITASYLSSKNRKYSRNALGEITLVSAPHKTGGAFKGFLKVRLSDRKDVSKSITLETKLDFKADENSFDACR